MDNTCSTTLLGTKMEFQSFRSSLYPNGPNPVLAMISPALAWRAGNLFVVLCYHLGDPL